MTDTKELRIVLTAKSWIGGRVRRAIEEYLWLSHLTYTIEETPGWFTSQYRIHIKGSALKVTEAHKTLATWLQKSGAGVNKVREISVMPEDIKL